MTPLYKSICSQQVCPTFVLLRIVLAMWGLLFFPMAFKISLPSSGTNPAGILIGHNLHFHNVETFCAWTRPIWPLIMSILSFLKILFIFRQRGSEGGREGEKHQCVVASWVLCTGDLACNPGLCPDWELNWQPFGSQPVLNPLSHTSQAHLFLCLSKTFPCENLKG